MVAALTLLPSQAHSSDEPPPGPFISPGESGVVGNGEKVLTTDPFEDPRLTQDAALSQASDRILDLAANRGLAGFAGTMIDHDTRSLVVYWNRRVPSALTDLISELRGKGVGVAVRNALHSAAELDQEARRIIGLNPETTGVRITAVGPLEDYSGVEVSVEPEDLAMAPDVIQSSFDLSFVPMPAVQAVGRWDDRGWRIPFRGLVWAPMVLSALEPSRAPRTQPSQAS